MNIKLLVIIDRFNWALHRQFLGFKPYLPNHYDVTLATADSVTKLQIEEGNIVYLASWNMGKWYPRLTPLCEKHYSKIIAGIHSHFSFEITDGILTLPDRDVPPSKETIQFLKQFKVVGAISSRLQRIFNSFLSNVYYLKAGVDPICFDEVKPVDYERYRLRVGWAGSILNQPGNRGYEKILLPLQHAYGGIFDFRFCVEHINGCPCECMSDYYNNIDFYLCTSRSEGASTPIREALACGRPVATTCVGDVPEIILPNQNGWLIEEWNLEATGTTIMSIHNDRNRLLQAAKKARPSILNGWTWEQVTPYWIEAFQAVEAA